MRWVGMPVSVSSLKRTAPETGFRNPMTVRKVVVLPAPLRPTRQTSSPAPTASEMPRRMRLVWISTTRPSTENMSEAPCVHGLARHLADDRRDDVAVAEELRGRQVREHAAFLQRHNAA